MNSLCVYFPALYLSRPTHLACEMALLVRNCGQGDGKQSEDPCYGRASSSTLRHGQRKATQPRAKGKRQWRHLRSTMCAPADANSGRVSIFFGPWRECKLEAWALRWIVGVSGFGCVWWCFGESEKRLAQQGGCGRAEALDRIDTLIVLLSCALPSPPGHRDIDHDEQAGPHLTHIFKASEGRPPAGEGV